MGFYQFGVPKDLVERLKKVGNIDVFVETGTFTGGTSRWAASLFDQVYTIEINPELREKAMKLSEAFTNIHFLLGNSRDVLPEYLPKFGNNCLFWLDGHYSGGLTGGEDEQCPIMEELQSIVGIENAYILIDDARCFLGRPPQPLKSDQWPRIDEIFSFLKENFPTHRFSIHDDVIVCVPEAAWEAVEDDWVEKYWDRFPANPQKMSSTGNFLNKLSLFVKYRILQNEN
ncbi:MAG: hypothetical protein AAF824_01480 [Bacteroidota bacterium]